MASVRCCRYDIGSDWTFGVLLTNAKTLHTSVTCERALAFLDQRRGLRQQIAARVDRRIEFESHLVINNEAEILSQQFHRHLYHMRPAVYVRSSFCQSCVRFGGDTTLQHDSQI